MESLGGLPGNDRQERRRFIFTEAPHSARAPSVRRKELLFFGALWRNRVR
jgi:hypothetical protein